MPSLSGADKVADRLATLEGKLDTPSCAKTRPS